MTSANDSGVWWLPGGGTALTKLIREGDAGFAAGETVKTFQVLKTLSGSTGHGRGLSSATTAHLQVTLKNGSASRQAEVLAEAGALTEIAATGDALGGTVLPLATWKTMNLPSSGNGGAYLSVLGTLTSDVAEVTAANARGIFASADSGAKWDPVIRVEDSVPGLDTGEVFAGLRDPVNAGDSAGVAFGGTIKGGEVRSTDNETLWWKPAGGELTLLAREGARPPGAPVGAKWKKFTSLALPGGQGGPIFTATLKRGAAGAAATGGITKIDDVALYAVDSAGTLRELLRENQFVVGKKVKTFQVLKAVSGGAGSARSYNAAKAVVALVTFDDRVTGIVKIAIP